jgi:quercetin dioxygenase-like cupin family protein
MRGVHDNLFAPELRMHHRTSTIVTRRTDITGLRRLTRITGLGGLAGLALAVLAVTSHLPSAEAEPAGFKRVELQRHDVSTPDREAVLARAEFAPGAVTPKHTHPGEEIAYVIEGEIAVEIEGKPAVKLKAGDSFFVPAGQAHLARNIGKTAAAVVSTYVVEKGKPLATPVK